MSKVINVTKGLPRGCLNYLKYIWAYLGGYVGYLRAYWGLLKLIWVLRGLPKGCLGYLKYLKTIYDLPRVPKVGGNYLVLSHVS